MSGDDNRGAPPPKPEEDDNDKPPASNVPVLLEEKQGTNDISDGPSFEVVASASPYGAIARAESSETLPGAVAIPGVMLRRQHHISSEMTRQEVLVHATIVMDTIEDREQPTLVFEALPLVLRRNGVWKWITAVSLLVLAVTISVGLMYIQSSTPRDNSSGSTTGGNSDTSDKTYPIERQPSGDPSSAPTMAPKTVLPTSSPTIRKSVRPSGSFSPSQTPTQMASAYPSLNPSDIPSTAPTGIPTSAPSMTPSLPPSIYIPQWTEVGPSIVGETAADYLGQAIAISRFGNVLAVGSHLYDFDAQLDAGKVRVYQLSDDSWEQIGQDIVGSAAGDQAGWAIDLSADGSILAVASFTGGQNLEGAVRMYEYNRSFDFWAPLGQDLYGGEDAAFFGGSIALSDAGSTVVVGADMDDGGGENAGRVQIFYLNRLINAWIQVGQTFYGDEADDNAGSVVSMSGNGEVVGLGVPRKNVNGAMNAGLVRVYKLHETGLAWTPIGDALTGVVEEENFGLSAALSEDGMVLAVSSRSRVHIYHFDETANNWLENEVELVLEARDDIFDRALEEDRNNVFDNILVDLSPDGRTIAVSTSGDDTLPGAVQAYEIDDTTGQWLPLGRPIENTADDGTTVPSVYLSGNRQLAVGFPKHSFGASLNLGKVQVYQFPADI